MITCPKCGNRIPARKLLFLARFNTTITCTTCASKLQWKNKRTGSLIGGVGGGLGTLLLINWSQTGNVVYLTLFAGLLATVFFAAWVAMVKFTRFEQVTA